MSPFPKQASLDHPRLISQITVTSMILWSLLVLVFLLWNLRQIQDHTQHFAQYAAEETFKKDTAFLYWATNHGGVYVPVTQRTPPNPHLDHVPERDLVTPSGKRLTLMNPAYMLRQVMEDFHKLYGIKGKITSLKPLNPSNAPDAWERAALHKLEKGSEEISQFMHLVPEGPVLRTIRPLFVAEGCLKCHRKQGYKKGDLRGGVSVTVPMQRFYDLETKSRQVTLTTHGLVWFFGLMALGFFGWQGKTKMTLLRQTQKNLVTKQSEMEFLVEQQALVLENTNIGLALIQNNQIQWCNHRFCKLLDRQEFQLLGTAMKSYFRYTTDCEALLEGLKDQTIDRLSREALLKRGQEEFWAKVILRRLRRPGPVTLLCMLEDIQIQRQHDEKLQHYQFMVNASKDFMTLIDRNYQYVAANDAYVASQSLPRAEILARSVPGLWGGEIFDRLIRPRMERAFAGEVVRYETSFQLPALGERVMEVTFYPFSHRGEINHLVVVSHDITELKTGEKALILAKEKAEEINRLKSDFINNISHELRTPLTVILSNVAFFLDPNDLPSPQDTLEIGQDIKDAASHLLALVNDLLDFSKLEAGKMQLRPSLLESTSAVSDALEMMRPLAQNKGIELKAELQDFRFLADPVRFKQILLNLLSNSLKFTDQGSVTVEAMLEKDRAWFAVRDTGCGISAKDLPHIFSLFMQADSSLTRASQGTGLGLAITRKLVEAHGGEINVESQPQVGSLFRFWLPLGNQNQPSD